MDIDSLPFDIEIVYIGRCDLETFALVWPQRRLIDGATLMIWYSDARANGKCAAVVGELDPQAAAEALQAAGLITLAKVQP